MALPIRAVLLPLATCALLPGIAAAQPASGQVHTLAPVSNTGVCLAGASSSAGSAVVQATCDGGAEQQWTLNAVSSGKYQLISKATGLCLDVAGYTTTEGAKIDQWTCQGSGHLNQIWSLAPSIGGGYELVSALSNQCLDVPGASTASGVQLEQWACKAASSASASNQSWVLSEETASPPPPPPPTAGNIPAGLPHTFFVGLAVQADNQDESWVTSSGVPWAVCYQYIASGVNPSQSWVTTWGQNFALNYANWAHGANCIPELTYYQMEPTIGQDGAQAEYAALQNTQTMAYYYADFTALMKQLGQFGGAAIVHVEPDLWGYLEGMNGGSPTQMTAAVASTGNGDLAGIPNTLAGFGQALITLRNKYAPKVILAPNVSTWLWNTSASANVTSIAQNDAAWMAATSGALSWDIYFADITDRDAAYYQYVLGDGGAHWWSSANFAELNSWAATFTKATGKRLVLWQLPVGNMVMDTCNNTQYHYQDNRAQTWLQNYPSNAAIANLAKSGIIGLLFGAGNTGTTQPFDADGDGIFNPAPIDGNTQKATVADDDGGFLRSSVGAYYKAGALTVQ